MSTDLDFPKCRFVLATPHKSLNTAMLCKGIFNPLDVREQIDVNQRLWRQKYNSIIGNSPPCHQPAKKPAVRTWMFLSRAIRFAVRSFPFLRVQSTSQRSKRISAHLANSGSVVVCIDSIVARCSNRSRNASNVGLPAVSFKSESYGFMLHD